MRLQGPGLAVGLLVLVVGSGTLGFHWTEGWTFWRAFYVTVIGLMTVDLPDLSPPGQALSLLVLFTGVGAAVYTFTLIAAVVVEGGLPKRLQRIRHQRMLETIHDHFILCGYGRIGSTVAEQFRLQNIPYVVIERSAERLKAAVDDGGIGVEGDASRDDVLRRVGIERARGMIAAVGTDAENVYAVLSARVLRPDLYIVGRAETEDATAKLKRAGADRVISPYQIGGVHIAQTALRPAVVDFVTLATSSDSLDLAMEEVLVAPVSSLANRTIVEANLRQRFGVIVVSVQRQNGQMVFNPEPEMAMLAGDKLVVLGRPESLKRLSADASARS